MFSIAIVGSDSILDLKAIQKDQKDNQEGKKKSREIRENERKHKTMHYILNECIPYIYKLAHTCFISQGSYNHQYKL